MNEIFKVSGKKKKVAKGYRLSPETHRIIGKIKKILKTDYDDAINRACFYYCEALRSHIKKIKSNSNKIISMERQNAEQN